MARMAISQQSSLRQHAHWGLPPGMWSREDDERRELDIKARRSALVLTALAVAGISVGSVIAGGHLRNEKPRSHRVRIAMDLSTDRLSTERDQHMAQNHRIAVQQEQERQAAAAAAAEQQRQAEAAAEQQRQQAVQAQQQQASRSTARAPIPPAGSVKDTARRLMASMYGWGDDQFSCLDPLWTKESGWNPYSSNASGAYGIPQALPGDKMASSGSDWKTNPATQIKWGLGYIKGRYGTPCAAWSFWQGHHWY
jgi:hypothetical protein